MRNTWIVFRREFTAYFATPVAYVFLIVFLALAGALTFYIGEFFERGQADLQAFLTFHPWLYLFLIPAVSMRLWAEERRTGTIEALLTLPLSVTEAVVGKYLAAWAFIGIALILTFPIALTVNFLGEPDNGVIVAGYIGSFLMAGGLLAIGACFSALTKNQVIAFVVAAALCVIFTLSGSPVVLNFIAGWLPMGVVNTVASFSFLTHFNAIIKGVIEVRDMVFYVSFAAFFLFTNVLIVDLKKAG